MKKVLDWLQLAGKRTLFLSVPLGLFLYLVYEVLLDFNSVSMWPGLLSFLIPLGCSDAGRYKTIEVTHLATDWQVTELTKGRWKELTKHRNTYTFRPRFDYPYSFLSGDHVQVRVQEGRAFIRGPEAYVEQLQEDLIAREVSRMKRITSRVLPVLPLLVVLLPTVFYSGFYADFKVSQHNRQAQAREKLEIGDNQAVGNSEANSNNYGNVAEYGDWIFLVEDHLNLVRKTKDLQETTYLIKAYSGTGINQLNIVDGWIFYSQGEKLNRMRTDGTRQETIYELGYQTDIHVIGDTIYFISFERNSALYRMDVNGQNLERLVNKPVRDLAIYDGRIFYSYEEDGSGFLESVDLEGKDSRIELAMATDCLIRWGGHFYFLDTADSRLYRAEVGGDRQPELLVNSPVSSFVVTGQGIYYSLHSRDGGYPGQGLYKVSADGTANALLAKVQWVEGLGVTEDWLFFQGARDGYTSQFRLDLRTDEIVEVQ